MLVGDEVGGQLGQDNSHHVVADADGQFRGWADIASGIEHQGAAAVLRSKSLERSRKVTMSIWLPRSRSTRMLNGSIQRHLEGEGLARAGLDQTQMTSW